MCVCFVPLLLYSQFHARTTQSNCRRASCLEWAASGRSVAWDASTTCSSSRPMLGIKYVEFFAQSHHNPRLPRTHAHYPSARGRNEGRTSSKWVQSWLVVAFESLRSLECCCVVRTQTCEPSSCGGRTPTLAWRRCFVALSLFRSSHSCNAQLKPDPYLRHKFVVLNASKKLSLNLISNEECVVVASVFVCDISQDGVVRLPTLLVSCRTPSLCADSWSCTRGRMFANCCVPESQHDHQKYRSANDFTFTKWIVFWSFRSMRTSHTFRFAHIVEVSGLSSNIADPFSEVFTQDKPEELLVRTDSAYIHNIHTRLHHVAVVQGQFWCNSRSVGRSVGWLVGWLAGWLDGALTNQCCWVVVCAMQ